MGKLCSCDDLNNENYKEFYGFKNDNNIIIKKKFNEYQENDKIFYGKTNEYEKIIKNKINNENKDDNEPKEYMNGTVKIIRI